MQEKVHQKDIVNILNFFIDNLFVEFSRNIFQQAVGILMGTNCARLLADLFVFPYKAVLQPKQ